MDQKLFLIFALIFVFRVWAEPETKNCFEFDIDYQGTNINDGLQQRTNTAEDCWTLCKLTLDCEGFTWASSNFGDADYRNACWLKKDVWQKYEKSEAVSGPKECGDDPTGSCCKNLLFDSTGNLIDSEQNHILGNYGRLSDGSGDRWNYQQSGGYERKLWYNPSINAWFIGDNLGTNEGYALADGDAQCPENLPRTWKWWAYSQGVWVTDDDAKFECLDGPTHAPTPDSCLSGAACDDCSLTVEHNGLTYCCNNYCDIGWINVDPATDPLCQCGHD